MDEIVQRAMAKWPNVPAVFGWLALDRRGNWSIKGERLANPAMIAFIGRNYAGDDEGRWFFQNGPQRVFVSLAYTPLVFRLEQRAGVGFGLSAHTGLEAARPRCAWIDDTGSCLLETELGVGLLHDQDLPAVLSLVVDSAGRTLSDPQIDRLLDRLQPSPPDAWLQIGARRLPLARIESARVAARFRFNPEPKPAPGEPEC